MVFVYLPFYFGIGVILFFAWRLAAQSWKRYGPTRPSTAQAVDGEAPNAPARTGNAANAIAVSLIIAFVIGLVGFAIGRATLPKGVFVTDFPEGWGPFGFELPSVVIGVLAASFFAGDLTRTRAPEGDAKDVAEDAWLRRDRGRAILLAAAAFFLAFAALQYDYKLLDEVTKFSAGPVVSLELAQPAAKTNESPGSRISTTLVAAAQPRTNSIIYVTKQLKQIADFPDEDDRTGQIFSGVAARTYSDQLLDNVKTIFKDCISPLGNMLITLQNNHHSEFPSVNGITITAADTDANNQQTGSARSERIVLMSSLLIRRLYDGISKFREDPRNTADASKEAEQDKQKAYVRNVALQFAVALRDYEASLISDLELLDDKTTNNSCADFSKSADLLAGLEITVPPADLKKSNSLGYLAMITALAEFADGNRESAIRLLHDRIDS